MKILNKPKLLFLESKYSFSCFQFSIYYTTFFTENITCRHRPSKTLDVQISCLKKKKYFLKYYTVVDICKSQ